jgi:peptidoglycan/LPS O-acetylase OafA/YrhL
VRLSVRRLAWMQRIAALAIALFWISFWADHNQLPANVVDFEWCFLVPDILFISGAFWIASNWLIARDPRAGTATAAAGSSMVYLGLLDAACNFRHGQYTDSFSRGALNAVVNVACVLFGSANIWYAMKRSKFEDRDL